MLAALRQWGDEFVFQPGETRARLVDREHGEPVATVEVRSADGRVLTPEDTVATMVG